MNSVGNKILLAVQPSQKTDYEMRLGDSDVRIWMCRGGFDKKHTGAVLAEVLEDKGEFKKGELVLTHHNAFDRDMDGEGRDFAGDTKTKTDDGRKVYAIELPMLFLKVGKDGLPAATRKYLIGQRIERPTMHSELYLPPVDESAKWFRDRFIVLRSHPDSEYKEGDMVYTDDIAGLPVQFVLNEKEFEVIRIAEDDILAIGRYETETFPDNLDKLLSDKGL